MLLQRTVNFASECFRQVLLILSTTMDLVIVTFIRGLNRISSGMVSGNFALPKDTIVGRFVMLLFKRYNGYLEKHLIEQSNILSTDHVLEVGYGPGLGLQHALEKADKGHVYGVDISQYAHKSAEHHFDIEIAKGQLTLFPVSVENIPLNKETIDKVVHCNTFYFWPSLPKACIELHRVLKPGGTMTATIDMDRVAASKKIGIIQNCNIDVSQYIEAMKHAGFEDVKVDYLKDDKLKQEFQCIRGRKSVKDEFVSPALISEK